MRIDLKNDLIIGFNTTSKRIEHKPLSTNFKEIEILQDGRILIIEDYYNYKYKDYSNLYCLNRKMEIDWFLPFPHIGPNDNDHYVGFTTNGERLFANTWNGFRVEFDEHNGFIMNTVFIK